MSCHRLVVISNPEVPPLAPSYFDGLLVNHVADGGISSSLDDHGDQTRSTVARSQCATGCSRLEPKVTAERRNAVCTRIYTGAGSRHPDGSRVVAGLGEGVAWTKGGEKRINYVPLYLVSVAHFICKHMNT